MARRDLDALLASREMVLVAGSGGVGKTTIAAAMGVAAVRRQTGNVLVLTVDPARRLANALGLEAVGNTPVQIPRKALEQAGIEARGKLYIAMLDTKAGWDELIQRHAPDEQTRDAVLANPLYQNITSRFVRSHDYLAMEQLHDLHATGDYDLVIVDTPPSRNALTILDAPSRMAEFFGSRLLRWLTVPYRSRLFTVASKPFYKVADSVLGSRFLQDIADFFVLFQAMEEGFVRRAREVESLLTDPRTAFVIVSTLEAAPTHEARYLARALDQRQMPLGAIVANRVLPASLASPAASAAAAKLAAGTGAADLAIAERVLTALRERDVPAGDADENAAGVGADDPAAEPSWDEVDAAQIDRILHRLAERFDDVAMVATREADRLAELAELSPLVVSVPWLSGDIHDLVGLGILADDLRGGSDGAESPR